jgi:CRP/FNR family transcriptional regulator, cyclic AMP receptor protein
MPLPIETQLQQAGLEVVGFCNGLSRQAPKWRHDAVLLEDLTDAEADALGALMLLVRAQPGQVMIREGDVGDWMLLILNGTVDVTKKSEQDEPSRLAVVKQGAAVGEMSMLDAAPRYASCTALEEVQAGVLTRATIARLIEDHPKVAAKLLVKLTQLLAQRLRNTSNQLVKLIQKK